MSANDPSSAANEPSLIGSLTLPRSCTLRSAAELKSALLAADTESKTLQLDASGVEQIDCSGLQLLVSLIKTRRRTGRTVSIVQPSAAFIRAIRLLGLDPWIELPETEVLR
jgi:anti-anti-sigma factor